MPKPYGVLMSVFALSLHAVLAASAADMPVVQSRGITITAWPPAPDDRFDVTLLPAAEGVQRLRDAVEEIFRRAPGSARAIATLTADGPVTITYHPHTVSDSSRLNTMNIALFVPDHGRPGLGENARSYLVIVNQHGIKWPLRELAAVLVHELAGHGMQHYRGRLAALRSLDRECEAYLYEERAYQELGFGKDTREMVQFRKTLENRYCSDFKTHMRRVSPSKMTLWDRRNLDVAALLAVFSDYVAGMDLGKTR